MSDNISKPSAISSAAAGPERGEGGPPEGVAAGRAGGAVAKFAPIPKPPRQNRWKDDLYKAWELTHDDIEKSDEWVAQLVDDQGGPENLTAARQALVDMAGRSYLIMIAASNYIDKRGIMRNREKGTVQSVLGDVMFPAMDRLARAIKQLGMDRLALKKDPLQAMAEPVAGEYEEHKRKQDEAREDNDDE